MNTKLTLKQLLAEIFAAGVRSRSDWAEALGVSEAAISQWVHKPRALPSSTHLGGISQTLARDDRFPQDLRDAFAEALDLPITDVVEKPRVSMGPTLRHYILLARCDAAFKAVRSLEPSEQLEVLADLGDRVRQRLMQPETTQPPLVFPYPEGVDKDRLGTVIQHTAINKQTLVMAG